MNEAFLELVDDTDSTTTRWPLIDGGVLGRSPDAAISLQVAEVSREHARFEQRPNGWWIVDLDSHNGTFVGGKAVGTEPLRLKSGDTIVLAGSVELRFVDVLATPMAPRIGRLHGLWIDPESRAVWVDAQRVDPPLSARQLDLLQMLYDAEGDVVDRPSVVAKVWEDVAAEGVSDEAVSALIKRLRGRLGDYETTLTHIEVIRGRGLRFVNRP